jgi:hypothetical protein
LNLELLDCHAAKAARNDSVVAACGFSVVSANGYSPVGWKKRSRHQLLVDTPFLSAMPNTAQAGKRLYPPYRSYNFGRICCPCAGSDLSEQLRANLSLISA